MTENEACFCRGTIPANAEAGTTALPPKDGVPNESSSCRDHWRSTPLLRHRFSRLECSVHWGAVILGIGRMGYLQPADH